MLGGPPADTPAANPPDESSEAAPTGVGEITDLLIASGPEAMHDDRLVAAVKAGVANFETFGTPGAMTFFGVAQECTLPLPQSPVPGGFEDEIFVVVYHVDNRSWGPFPGPTETYTGHLIFLLP